MSTKVVVAKQDLGNTLKLDTQNKKIQVNTGSGIDVSKDGVLSVPLDRVKKDIQSNTTSISSIKDQLASINLDQATLEVKSSNLVLTNEDDSKSTIALSKLAKISDAAGNSAEVRADGIYVPTVKPGNDGFDKISSDANNIIVNKANGLYAPKTTIKGGGGVLITGKGTPEDPFIITGGDITTVEGYLPKDVGVSCDPAIQMKTAVTINTIATWARPAVITSTKGATYSHSLAAHGEYESEDSVQWIASLDVVSPKQINFTVFHSELNYRANYYNGHVYLDIGLRTGQTFNGNKEIVFDVTEGECDDNVVGWVDGKKIYGRDIESPKFGDGDLSLGGNSIPRYLNFNPVHDILEVEYYNKAGEKRTVGLSQTAVILDPDHAYGNRLLRRNFSKSDNPDVRADVHVNPTPDGYMRLLPNRVDFTKPVRVRIIGKQFLMVTVSVPVKDKIPERYHLDSNSPIWDSFTGNEFSYNHEVLPQFIIGANTPVGGSGITADKLGHQIRHAGSGSTFVKADSKPEWFILNLPQAHLVHMNKFGIWLGMNSYGLSTDAPTNRDPYAALYIMHSVPEHELPPKPYDQRAVREWILANPEYSVANL